MNMKILFPENAWENSLINIIKPFLFFFSICASVLKCTYDMGKHLFFSNMIGSKRKKRNKKER